MKRVGLVLHAERGDALAVARQLTAALAGRGVEPCIPGPEAARVGGEALPAGDDFPEGCELVFVLGGDGTLLRAAPGAYRSGVPLLGVNLGRFGFLAALERGDLDGALDPILAGRFHVEERLVIEGEISGGSSLFALNDIVVGKATVGRAITFTLEVTGEPLLELAADGMIVATPTGSTAYSFSAGGPIVAPTVDCLVVTPVSPHNLFNRSLLVAPDGDLLLRVHPDPEGASLSADGTPAHPLPPDARVRLRAGAGRVRLARVAPAPFWRLVREKMILPAGSAGRDTGAAHP